MSLTEDNIRIVAQELIGTKGSFEIKDFHPYFNVVPAQGEVARCVRPLGYAPSPRNKHLFIKKPNPLLRINNVILAEESKEAIRYAISQIENNELIFEKWGFEKVFEKGTTISLLFWGPPGTGKTLMAQAIAEETNSDLRTYSTADIQSSVPGGAERTIRNIFAETKSLINGRKRIILFDECDSLLVSRERVDPILAAQINALLGEVERHRGIVIFTTNRLGKLDSALERRITTKVEFPFPKELERYIIWKRLIPKEAPIAKDVDLKQLAKYRMSGGNIKNALLGVVRKAAYIKAKEIDMVLILEAIEQEMSGRLVFRQ